MKMCAWLTSVWLFLLQPATRWAQVALSRCDFVLSRLRGRHLHWTTSTEWQRACDSSRYRRPSPNNFDVDVVETDNTRYLQYHFSVATGRAKEVDENETQTADFLLANSLSDCLNNPWALVPSLLDLYRSSPQFWRHCAEERSHVNILISRVATCTLGCPSGLRGQTQVSKLHRKTSENSGSHWLRGFEPHSQ